MGYSHDYYLRNKQSILEKTRAYIKSHPEVYARSHKNRLFKEHSTTREKYEAQVKEQDNKCAICRQEDTRDLSMDHDHACCSGENSCGKCNRGLCNRGLLCNACNKKLAVVEDETFLGKAKEYLRKWKA